MRTIVHQIQPFQPSPNLIIPFFLQSVRAGFPSPADDFIDTKLDLNDYLVSRPAATFFVRVTSHSMRKVGIHAGDLLIVDRSITPFDGSIIIAALEGELVIKKIRKVKDRMYLVPEELDYDPAEVKDETQFEVWGVVTNVIHKV